MNEKEVENKKQSWGCMHFTPLRHGIDSLNHLHCIKVTTILTLEWDSHVAVSCCTPPHKEVTLGLHKELHNHPYKDVLTGILVLPHHPRS